MRGIRRRYHAFCPAWHVVLTVPANGDMVARGLGAMEEISAASPAYLAGHGMPAIPDELDGHRMVGFVSSRTGQPLPLDFVHRGEVIEVTLPARLMVGGADSNAEAARLGLALTHAPKHRSAHDLASGAVLEVLAAFRPTPIPFPSAI